MPIQTFETAAKRGSVADGEHNFAIQGLGKPDSRKNSKWIFEQCALSVHTADEEGVKVSPHAQKVFARTNGFDFKPGVVLKIEQVAKSRQVFRCVLVVDKGVQIFYRGTKYAGTMQDIQRLADIGRIGIGGQHFANPGGATAMRASDKDGGGIIHLNIPTYFHPALSHCESNSLHNIAPHIY